MQTKQQLQQLLAMAGARPNKKLGQNFLIDLNLMRFLLDTAAITSDDLVLEVGCGTGSMTEGIAERAGRVIVVEYDKMMAAIASGRVGQRDNVHIINGDALATKNAINVEAAAEIEKVRAEHDRFLLVANLPYSIAASLMVNLILGPTVVDAMYVTIQKEVAQRMAAVPGDDLYGILSIVMAATGRVKFLKKLGPNCFWPAPQVDSAMVEYVRDESMVAAIDNLEIFRDVVGLLMGHRRKTVNACRKFAAGTLEKVDDWSKIFEAAQVDPSARGEQLAANDFVRIANIITRS